MATFDVVVDHVPPPVPPPQAAEPTSPPVIFRHPSVSPNIFNVDIVELVNLPVPVKSDVVVAPCAVKFCRVDEPLARKLALVVRPETVRDPSVPIVVRDERVVTDGVI